MGEGGSPSLVLFTLLLAILLARDNPILQIILLLMLAAILTPVVLYIIDWARERRK